MEAGRQGISFGGINDEARGAALEIVRNAETPDDLLIASRQHFNESVLSISASQIEAQLSDETLSARMRDLPAFDPTLFKGVVLFELSHLIDDESVIPTRMKRIIRLWRDAWDKTDEDLEHMFVAPAKRTDYHPFPVLSHTVVLGLILESIDEERAAQGACELDESNEPRDPLQEEIDGKKGLRMFIGAEEVPPREEAPILTRQLIHDLHNLYPHHIIYELEHRFPEDAEFADIQPLIERILFERANNLMPPDNEISRMYEHNQRRLRRWLSAVAEDEIEMLPEQKFERAKDYVKEFHRNPKLLRKHRDIYVLSEGVWFTVVLLASETEIDRYSRRIFYGDTGTPDIVEVPIDLRGPVIEELRREQADIDQAHGFSQRDVHIVESFGEFHF